jgi:hypothetical protein
MLARGTDNADVCAEANDLPFITTTGMRLAQPHYIAEPNFQRHSGKHYRANGRLVN